MGRKRQEKMARRAEARHPQPGGRAGKPAWGWLIGVVLVLGAAMLGVLIFVQANQVKFLKLGVLSMTQKVEQELNRYQGRFSLEDANRLRELLRVIENLAADRQLDLIHGGQLNFVLRVTEEIVLQGELQADELLKLNQVLSGIRAALDRGRTPTPNPRP